jgi:hypothetical protein
MDGTTLIYAAVLVTIVVFFGSLVGCCLCRRRHEPLPLQPPPNGKYVEEDGRWPGVRLKGPPASDAIP